jgi:hypothetical protein
MTPTPDFKIVDDLIAKDRWSYVDTDGNRRVSRIVIGRPQPWPNDPDGDWVVPVEIEHFTDGIRAFVGVGPVDALMNAMSVVKTFAEQIGQFTPRAQSE